MKQKRYLKVSYILLGFFAVLLLLSGVFMRLGGFSTGEAANVEAFQEYAQPVEKLTIPEGRGNPRQCRISAIKAGCIQENG